MFNLTLHDHLQLTFSEITQRYSVHAAKAQSRARWGRRFRGSEALLIGGVTLAAGAAAFGQGRIPSIVAASMAAAALIVLLVNLTFNFDASARAHAMCSTHLWFLRERYRSLLSDLHDGVLSATEARFRRDKLIDELRAIYEAEPVMALEDQTKLADIADDGKSAPPPAQRTPSAANTLDFSTKAPSR